MSIDPECYTCDERNAYIAAGDQATADKEFPLGECKDSKRPCGHHCNCSWIHDCCHWCFIELLGDDVKAYPSSCIVCRRELSHHTEKELQVCHTWLLSPS